MPNRSSKPKRPRDVNSLAHSIVQQAIDPQPVPESTKNPAYDDLMAKATRTKGNTDPYLQQLSRYDASFIQELRAQQRLAESIAVAALKTGMLKGQSDKAIKKKIEPLTDPKFTISHGRRVGADVAMNRCGLNIEEIQLNGNLWPLLWELYERVTHAVSFKCSKLVETNAHSFQVPFVGM